MSTGRKLYWLLVLTTVFVCGVMIFWASARLDEMSTGDGVPFDLRMFGYSHAEAQEYIASLTPGGAEFYLETAMLLDTFFPVMFALALAIGGWMLLIHKALVLRIGFATICAFYALFDYLENFAVSRMIGFEGGPEELPLLLVETASRWTVLKFFFVDAAVTVLIVLVIARMIGKPQAEQG